MEDTFSPVPHNQYWSEKAPFLGKWLWLLFWMVIPQALASLLNSDLFGPEPVFRYTYLFVPQYVIRFLGILLKVIYYLGCGLVLLKLSPILDRYRTSGICYLAGGVVTIATDLLPVSDETSTLALLVSLAGLLGVLALLAAEYQECMGHSELLEDLNLDLSRKWKKLWKLFIGCYAALFVSVLLLFVSALLGLFVTLAGTLGLLAVMILKLIYLYRTAMFFRRFPREAPEAGDAAP